MAYMDPWAGSFTEREAGHLARRTGFGPRPDEISSLTALGLDAAVSARLDYPAVDSAYATLLASLPNDASDLGRVKNPVDPNSLAGSWLHRLVNSAHPLQEQLALFLHDTLVSDFPKVASGVNIGPNYGNDGSSQPQFCTNGTLAPDPQRQFRIVCRLLAAQIDLYRTTGHLSYSALIKAVTRDPAMLLYLDNATNVRGKPQENYGREVMELFTMGVGNYTETDVKEASKAFTGETVNRLCSEDYPFTYTFTSSLHETGSKILFGTTFNLGAGDTDRAIDLIFQRISGASISPAHARVPATALYMSWKLITWFISESIPIDHPAVEELALVFDAVSVNGYRYDIREVLRTLLSSAMFYDEQYYYRMYKNPLEFVAGSLRALQVTEGQYTTTVARLLSPMGMIPYGAPNVAGWDHGRAWINSGSLIVRHNYGDRLSGSQIMTDARIDAILTSGEVTDMNDDAGLIEYFRRRLIHDVIRPEEVTALQAFADTVDGTGGTSTSEFRRKVRGMVHLFLTLPRFQLK